MPQHEALSTCKLFGASLAEPMSETENIFLKGMYADSGETFVWLGGHDLVTEGHWEYATGGEIQEFTDWLPGQPDNVHGGENCLSFWKNHWDDGPCTAKYRFICQYDLTGILIGQRCLSKELGYQG